MIKFTSKIFAYFLFFIFTIFLFLPKENIYFLLEKKLLTYKTIVSFEKINSNIFNFDIKNAYVFYDGIKFAKFQELKIDTYIYTNKIEMKNFTVFDGFKNIVPPKINTIEMEYKLNNPKTIDLKGEGDFGLFTGEVNLMSKKVNIFLKASKIMKRKYKNILRQMKFKNGKYEYEYKF